MTKQSIKEIISDSSDFTISFRQDSAFISQAIESLSFTKRAYTLPPRSPTRQTAAAVSLLGESLANSRFLHKKSGGTSASFAPLFMHHEAERDVVRATHGLILDFYESQGNSHNDGDSAVSYDFTLSSLALKSSNQLRTKLPSSHISTIFIPTQKGAA